MWDWKMTERGGRVELIVETSGDGAHEEGAEGAGECGNDGDELEDGLCGILLRQFPETPGKQ